MWHTQPSDLTSEELANVNRQAAAYRTQADMPNAVALQDQLAPLHYRFKRERFPEFDATLPAIVSSFMPKSGGTFLHNRLLEVGYMEFWWGITHPNSAAYVYAIPKGLELYLEGGCACHTHALPDPHTLTVFDRVKLERIWLHLRHPAETTVSSFHHYQGVGQGEGDIGAKRTERALADAKRLGLPSELDPYVRRGINFHVGWLRASAAFAERHPDRVYLTFHHELADPAALLSRVLSDFGGDKRTLSVTAKRPDDRRRLETRSDWRGDLSPDTIAHVEATVNERLSEFSVLEPIWATNAAS